MLTSQEWILGQANTDKKQFPISTPNKVEKAEESKLEKEQNKTIERRLTDNLDGFRIGLRFTVRAGEQRNLPQTYPRKTRLKCPVLLKPSLRFSKATQDMTSPPPPLPFLRLPSADHRARAVSHRPNGDFEEERKQGENVEREKSTRKRDAEEVEGRKRESYSNRLLEAAAAAADPTKTLLIVAIHPP